jgi:hypothetical protein
LPSTDLARAAAALAVAAILASPAPARSSGSGAVEAVSRLEVVGERVPDLGPFHQQSALAWTFRLRNAGERPVRVTGAWSVDPGGRVDVTSAPVPAGGEVALDVRQPLGFRLGRASFRYALRTDEPGSPVVRVGLQAFVESAFDPERLEIDLGTLDRALGGAASTELFSREVERLELTGTRGAPAWLAVETAGRAGLHGEGLRLVARLRPGAPVGVFSGLVELRTNVPRQPAMQLEYRGAVFGELVPSRGSIEFGLLREGESATARIEVRRRAGGTLELLSWREASGHLAVRPGACAASAPDCLGLDLVFTAPSPGSFAGTLALVFTGEVEELPLRYGAWVVKQGTQVRELALPGTEEGPR